MYVHYLHMKCYIVIIVSYFDVMIFAKSFFNGLRKRTEGPRPRPSPDADGRRRGRGPPGTPGGHAPRLQSISASVGPRQAPQEAAVILPDSQNR